MAKRLVALGLTASAALAGGYLIVPWEGAVKDKQGFHISYLDVVGIPTLCYGETQKGLYGEPIKLGMKYTDDECLQLLARSIPKYEKDVERLVKVDFKSPYQKSALISFTYNVGVGNVSSSTLLRELNRGNHAYACGKLADWVYAKKKKLKGLVSRRAEEYDWCMGQVPYEVKTTYGEIVDLFRDTTESNVLQEETRKEEEEQALDYSIPPCQPSNGSFYGWVKYAWCSRNIDNI